MTDPATLAAATADAPGGSGNATKLAALAANNVARRRHIQPVLRHAGRAGWGGRRPRRTRISSCTQQLLTQAQGVREQTSGVSLDEEATRLIQFQRAYQASAQLLSVLNQLTGTVINMLQG